MSLRPFFTAFASATLGLLAVRSTSGFQGPTLAPAALQSFEFQPRAGLILLPVSVEGKVYDFAVDTGSSRTIFDLSLRSKLGEPLGATKFNGSVRAEEFKWPMVRAGDMNLVSEERVVCLDLSEIRKATQQEFYGILGMDWLQGTAFEIDFDRGRLTFLRSSSLPPRFLSTGILIEVERCQARVAVDVKGLGRVPFLIDTGCLGHPQLLSEDCWHLKKKGKMIGLGSGANWGLGRGMATTEVAAVESLKLGDFVHDWPIFESTSDEDDRLLGLELWSRYVVTFDFPNRSLYLRKGDRFGVPWVYNRSGLSISEVKGVATVRSIRPDSQSAKLGIKPGDILVSVDGKPVAGCGIWELDRLLSVVGKPYKVRLRRNGKEFEVELLIPDWRRFYDFYR